MGERDRVKNTANHDIAVHGLFEGRQFIFGLGRHEEKPNDGKENLEHLKLASPK